MPHSKACVIVQVGHCVPQGGADYTVIYVSSSWKCTTGRILGGSLFKARCWTLTLPFTQLLTSLGWLPASGIVLTL